MGELNTTFKRMSNTLFKRVVYFFAQALNPARCHTPHRRKKARSGRASSMVDKSLFGGEISRNESNGKGADRYSDDGNAQCFKAF